jgi:hypothetical protein
LNGFRSELKIYDLIYLPKIIITGSICPLGLVLDEFEPWLAFCVSESPDSEGQDSTPFVSGSWLRLFKDLHSESERTILPSTRFFHF